MFRAVHGCLPLPLQKLFTPKTSLYRSRKNHQLKLYDYKKNVKRHCLSWTGVKLWNELDNNTADKDSLAAFSRGLTNQLNILY